ncbi:MAG: radical SAM protein [Mariprofundaceae bacterium]|nr:radical SAM protein [Mariprofundaceae bacterium]
MNNSKPSLFPVVLHLPEYRSILVTQDDNNELNLQADGHHASISGTFAESLNQLIVGIAQTHDIQRLKMLEKQHHWLHGLSQASTHKQSLQSLLMGESLGMLFIEVTDQCNERCIHCYASSSPDCNDFLSLDEIKHSLDFARSVGRPFVQFTGGDPLIHKELLAAVAYAAKLDFQGIEIYTNGLLLSETLLTKLAPYQPRISFSLYADTAELHDSITQLAGSWKKTLAAMKRAKHMGFDIRAGIALMPENIACVDRMTPFLEKEIGIDAKHVRFDPVKQTGRGQFMDGAKQILIAPSHTPKTGDIRRGKLCIAANGNVYPCVFSRKVPLGNIRQKSLPNIIKQLTERKTAAPSVERWKSCRESLSCGDCQMIAYALGAK